MWGIILGSIFKWLLGPIGKWLIGLLIVSLLGWGTFGQIKGCTNQRKLDAQRDEIKGLKAERQQLQIDKLAANKALEVLQKTEEITVRVKHEQIENKEVAKAAGHAAAIKPFYARYGVQFKDGGGKAKDPGPGYKPPPKPPGAKTLQR